MKIMRKKIITCICLVLMLSTTTAMASSNRSVKVVNGYGHLTGYINTLPYTATTVTYNTDNAYLTCGIEIQDKNHSRISNDYQKSSTGETSFDVDWGYIGVKPAHIYGAHGVQGGSVYSSEAVYTYTWFE